MNEAFLASHTSPEETIFGKAKIALTVRRLKAVRPLMLHLPVCTVVYE